MCKEADVECGGYAVGTVKEARQGSEEGQAKVGTRVYFLVVRIVVLLAQYQREVGHLEREAWEILQTIEEEDGVAR
ncbi:MAG: hypothetical protein FJ280_08770 [Planctomycetes bacterium]|nr:hypothetical protein [Planctomycetota bacterium]